MFEGFFGLFNNLTIILILYIVGSIPFAILTTKFLNLPDPRNTGSCNPGATNVLRTGNKLAAVLTLIGDMLKGYIPILFLIEYNYNEISIYLLSLAILFGHIFSCFLNFKGGKGVATSFGFLLAIDIKIGISSILVWIIALVVSKVSAISALTSFFALPFIVYYFTDNQYMFYISILNTLIIFLTHSKNIFKYTN